MSALVSKKTSRLDMRLSEENKALLQKAAIFLEQDLSSFVMSVALREASKIVEEFEQREHSRRDQETIFALLTTPQAPSEALSQAAKRYKTIQKKLEEA